jgi:MFS family permease
MTESSVSLLRSEAKLLGFGFIMALVSSAGQTFFISWFSAEWRVAFDLGHGDFGSLYSAATLTSGFLLIWVGGMIDRVDLRWFGACVIVGLAVAAGMAAAVQGPLTLLVALFLLRFFGQGLSSHTAVTATARYADPRVRGKAVSIATLGFPIGEGLCPILVVGGGEVYGPSMTYGGTALIIIAVVLPVGMGLLLGHGTRHAAFVDRTARANAGDQTDAPRQWTRAEVIRDRLFQLSLLATMAPSFIVTGIFFHQVYLIGVKNWDMTVFAGAYVGFAIAQVSASILAGWFIDRYGARRLAVVYLLPLCLGCFVLSSADGLWAGFVFMVLGGLCSGASGTLLGTLWAELYGVAHLGAIRALVSAFSVVASALSPASMGWAIDAGVTIETLVLLCGAYLVGAVGLMYRLHSPKGGRPFG